MSDDQSAGYDEQTFIELEAGSEWRFELEADENIAVRVHSPDPVFINSEELPPTTWYPLYRNLKSAIYAPSPARIEVTSLSSSQYISTSTTQPQILSLHLALELIRILARRNLIPKPGQASQSYSENGIHRGPRVMVVGPPCSGKTTIVKSLVNMAVGSGMGWTPCVVGLDPASPSNLIPGSLSLSTPTHPIPTHHSAHPLGSPPASVAASTMSADVSTLGWWYGQLEPTTRGMDLWRKLVSTMGEKWSERSSKDPMSMASGLIVDTSSAFTNPTLGTRKDDPKAKYTLLLQAVESFQIDTLLVISHEKLQIELDRLLSPRGVTVLRFPKSGGVVDVDDTHRQMLHSFQVRSYFYGEPELPKELGDGFGLGLMGRVVEREKGLSPYSFQIGWETLSILRVGEGAAAPSTALPLGSSRILSPTRLTKVDPKGPAHVTRLLNTVLAVVAMMPEDRIKKDVKVIEGVNAEVKDEVTEEAQPKGEEGEEQDAVPVEEDDDDDDEVPFREEIGWREVLGFIVITAIDTQRKKYTVLSPSPGKLPATVAIAGAIEWVDVE